ncbi:MAG: histidinol-phosphate transaminase [Pseudomonadota bacterium]
MSFEDHLTQLLDTWIRPELQDIAAYPVADARGLIKLDAMENPYPWPDALRKEWQNALIRAEVNRYPDPTGGEIRELLRTALALPTGQEILLGNGSDELIQLLMLAVGGAGRTVLFVEPSFVMYQMIARFTGTATVGVPLTADFELDREDLLAAIAKHRPALVFLAYPNNPTGNLFDAGILAAVIAASPGLVIIDEAYAPFTDASFIPRLGQSPNLLVMRTLSKMGLAGLRLGYLAGPAAWIAAINKLRLPYNINTLTQISVALALRHPAPFASQTAAIRQERTRLAVALMALPDDVQVFPSEANFLLFRVLKRPANAVFASIKRQGILIKNLQGHHPMLSGCLRVTVGQPGENDAFLAALRASLAED